MRPRTRQVHSLLLLIGLVGGELGLPTLDAFLYHGRPDAVRPQGPALAEEGRVAGHGRLWVLGSPFVSLRFTTSRGLPTALGSPRITKRLLVEPVSPVTASTLALPLSRAPPAFLS